MQSVVVKDWIELLEAPFVEMLKHSPALALRNVYDQVELPK